MKKIVAFDTLRFILALCVVFGHTFIVLMRNAPTQLVVVQNLAVDGFFILSGFLLAMSCARRADDNPGQSFVSLTKSRILRLYPEYLFAILFTIVMGAIFGLHTDTSALMFNLVFIAQVNKVPAVVNGSWYISVLFWVGCLYSAVLLNRTASSVRQSSMRLLTIPLISLIAFTCMYTSYTGLSLNSEPLFAGILSAGFLKGLLDIGIGIFAFDVCQYLRHNPIRLRFSKAIFVFMELAVLAVLVVCMGYRHLSQTEYLVLFAFPVLIGLYYFRKETITRFFSWHGWERITPAAYTLFLTHVVILDAIRQSGIPVRTYPRIWTYIVIALICVVVAYVCYHAQKWLFGKLKAVFLIENGGTGK